jgi:hypothetical protein
MLGKPKLKISRLLVALITAFVTLALVFLSLSLSSSIVQAAPAAQDGVLELVLPVINTSNQTSVYTVTHLGGTAPISTFHSFYAGGFPGGQIVAIYSDSYNPLETKVYSPNKFPNFPPDFVGDVVIISTQPITGSVISIQPPTIVVAANQPTVDTTETNPILPPLSPPSILLPERVEINWTVVTYIIVGLFALSGFFKGWWKEAITTFFIGILIFFLAVPRAAEWFIDTINRIISFIWDILVQAELVTGQAIQLDGRSGGTWLVILLLFIGLAIFISRASLPNVVRGGGAYHTYIVTPLGGILGGLLGGLNGFLILNLARQYLEGSNLPGGGQPAIEIAMTGTSSVAIASSGVDFRVIDLPNFTIFNVFLPWVIIAFSILVLFLTWRYRKIPWGYVKYSVAQEKEMIVVVPVVVQG